jgi:hypothetical protein
MQDIKLQMCNGEQRRRGGCIVRLRHAYTSTYNISATCHGHLQMKQPLYMNMHDHEWCMSLRSLFGRKHYPCEGFYYGRVKNYHAVVSRYEHMHMAQNRSARDRTTCLLGPRGQCSNIVHTASPIDGLVVKLQESTSRFFSGRYLYRHQCTGSARPFCWSAAKRRGRCSEGAMMQN